MKHFLLLLFMVNMVYMGLVNTKTCDASLKSERVREPILSKELRLEILKARVDHFTDV